MRLRNTSHSQDFPATGLHVDMNMSLFSTLRIRSTFTVSSARSLTDGSDNDGWLKSTGPVSDCMTPEILRNADN